MTNPNPLVSKLWNDCSILRDDGLSYGDYVEQLTFLLLAPSSTSGFAQRFALPVSAVLRLLKMADEQSRLRGTPRNSAIGLSLRPSNLCGASVCGTGRGEDAETPHLTSAAPARPGT